MSTKICKKCKEEKELSEFYTHRTNKDRRRGVCKNCWKQETNVRQPCVHLPIGSAKACTRCKEAKELSEFSKHPRRKDGYQNQCKACCAASHNKWYTGNPEKEKERVQMWRDQNPEKHQRQKEKAKSKPDYAERNRNGNLLKNYGLVPEQYEEMLGQQNHRCAICKSTDTGTKKTNRLFVDHCHTTGQIRGLLCHNCNNGLGRFKDNTEFLRSAIKYLDNARMELMFVEETQRRVEGYSLVAQSAA